MILASVLVGAVAAGAAIAFREAVIAVQWVGFGGDLDDPGLLNGVLSGWRIFVVLTLGGLGVGLFTVFFMVGRRPQGVAQVIEANAISGGKMTLRDGIGAAVISAMSIGAGASAGREGPVVHMGATLASFIGQRMGLGRSQLRILLGCGVAAAVAASFNAPVAGVFFALEVVIGHYALAAFAPIVAASVVGTTIARMSFGDVPAFDLPSHPVVSILEFPAYAILGLTCAVVAIIFLRTVPLVERGFQMSRLPDWSQPAVAGAIVACIAIYLPEVLGVGYLATDIALKEGYGLIMLMALAAGKLAATAICLGGRFGGGVFSPALFLGAMVGGAYGYMVALPFPELSSGSGAYAIVGMAALAGAVLGAPVSTILIVFELTGDYKITTGVMIAVVTASAVVRQFHGVSFFVDQIKRLGLDLEGAHETGAINQVHVRDLMRQAVVTVTEEESLAEIQRKLIMATGGVVFAVGPEGNLLGSIALSDRGADILDGSIGNPVDMAALISTERPVLLGEDELSKAVRLFSELEIHAMPVVDDLENRKLIGIITERDTMRAYADGLLSIRAEEHGEKTTHRLMP